MPFNYDNAAPPCYSEAYRTWETPQDWTIRGGTDLSLWLQGWPASFIEDPNGRIIVNAFGGDTDGTNDNYCFVRKQLVGNGEIIARIDSLSNAKGWARAGVMICDTLGDRPRCAAMTVTAEHGGFFLYRTDEGTSAVRINNAGIQTPCWVKLTRTGGVFTARHSTDGETWLDVLNEEGKPVAATVDMPANVYVGPCVIGDRWDQFATGEFGSVTVSGDVRGPWQATHGGLNSRDDLYVALEDAVGRLAVSVHPDPAALNFTEWTQWRIPLRDFASLGVDVAAIKTMYIGVGNRDNPQPDGSGMIHIDDIHVLPADAAPFTMFGPHPGVRVKYFRQTRSGPQLFTTRVEDSIDHDWGEGEIVAGLSNDLLGVWIANLEVPLSGTYTLITDSYGAARLWLDGWCTNHNWPLGGPSDEPIEIRLEAGHPYALKMEWFHRVGPAKAQLWWEGPSIPWQIIPAGPLQLPLLAAGPYPPNGAADVPQSPLLTWRAGEAATHHDIYFGDDANAVAAATLADAAYRGRLSAKETAFDPGALEWNKTYFWRVDEVNDADPNNSWKGQVWRFTTADLLVIDDFESYGDEEDNRLYEYWIDGFSLGWSSVVARIPPGPYVERTIVHGGRQSMPFDYNNVPKRWFSEIERDFESAQNWRVNGVDTLVLYVHGRATNAPAPLFVAVGDSAGKTATAVHSDAKVTQATEWIEWRIPLSQFAGVNAMRVKRLTLGVGARAEPAPGGAGRIYIDDIRVVKP
jgi:hypothetical protein